MPEKLVLHTFLDVNLTQMFIDDGEYFTIIFPERCVEKRFYFARIVLSFSLFRNPMPFSA